MSRIECMYAPGPQHAPEPVVLAAHPNLADTVNHNVIQSEVEGGIHLNDLPRGAALAIQTRSRFYTLVNLGEEGVLISGHPEFCPEPVLVRIQGSTWGGSMLKTRFVGRGMHLEFQHPVHHTVITSQILEIHVRS